jgi:hypothetical protein
MMRINQFKQAMLLAGFTLAGLGGLVAVDLVRSQPVTAVVFPDGTVAFDRPPNLERIRTTRNQTSVRRAAYYFEIDMPASAGEPLQRLTLEQRSQQLIRFDLSQTQATVTTAEGQRQLPVASAQRNPDTDKIEVEFAEAAPPDSQVSVRLLAQRNPRWGGVYQFGVTAFPEGETVRSQFIGYGRLNFYENDRDRRFPFP